MKRVFFTILVVLLIVMTGCGKSDRTANKTSAPIDTSADPAGPTTDKPSEHTEEPVNLSTDDLTLMIYMMGSDLESKTGSATDDLSEIAGSGIDLGKANVIVCAGGTTAWHTEAVSADYINYMKLGTSGFECVKTDSPVSMGEADTLSDFINYCTSTFNTSKYALILWDHGNGPVIGYGKDILFGKDALTLAEMRSAMSKTIFGGSNKLLFVGFDACLMASAELACIWSDYADYLIASQEVEPCFGWDYSFLSGVGTDDLLTLTDSLMTKYLSTCEKYYERKKFENRDTTISCIDLRYANELNDAINALFSKASAEIDNDYNKVAAPRVSTRAFGRASTGSEYDLVDLGNLAEQYKSVFPEESSRLLAAVNKTVLNQKTNADLCSGLSLYYPFYNKYYYENGWAEAYKQLGLFEKYADYLQKYDKIWLLGDEELQKYATSNDPENIGKGQYTYKLTEEQAKRYASSRYYILKNDGGDKYVRIYSSSNLTFSGDTVTAFFDGNIIYGYYGKDGKYMCTPYIEEYDTVNGITRYQTCVFNLYNGSFFNHTDEKNCRLILSADSINRKVSISGALPRIEDEESGTFYDGKEEDIDLFDWDELFWWTGMHNILKRSEKGYVEAFDNWYLDKGLIAFSFSLSNGFRFGFAPLDSDDYCLMIEIEDTQGNKYCSNPIPIETQDIADENEPIEEAADVVEWKDSDTITILSQDGVSLKLFKYDDTLPSSFTSPYFFFVDNKNAFPVNISIKRITINDSIDNKENISGEIPANSYDTLLIYKGVFSSANGDLQYIDLDPTLKFGELKSLNSIQLYITVERADNGKTIADKKAVKVIFSDKTSFDVQKEYNEYE